MAPRECWAVLYEDILFRIVSKSFGWWLNEWMLVDVPAVEQILFVG